MKISQICIAFLITVCSGFSQDINISVRPRGGDATVAWKIQMDTQGMVSYCSKVLVNDGTVLEEVRVEKTATGYVSHYVNKQSLFNQEIQIKGPELKVLYQQSQGLQRKTTSGERMVSLENDILEDRFDGALTTAINTRLGTVSDRTGKVIKEFQGSRLQSHDSSEIFSYSTNGDSIEVEQRGVPEVVPATIIRITGPVDLLSRNLTFNYCVLPRELLYVLLLSLT